MEVRSADAAGQRGDETARFILAVARRLLAERGFRALSFDSLAREAGVHRDTVRYHYRGKMGLVSAVMDSLTQDLIADVASATRETATSPSRLTPREMASRILFVLDAGNGRLDILPHALRDPDLQGMAARGSRDFADLVSSWLGIEPKLRDVPPAVLSRFGVAIAALLDGLSIQVGMDTISRDDAARAVELVIDCTVSVLASGEYVPGGRPAGEPESPADRARPATVPIDQGSGSGGDPAAEASEASTSTYDAILAAARRLLMERGFRALSFDSVASELDVDKGTIRYHFGNKMGLVSAVSDAFVHVSMADIFSHVENRSSEDTYDVAHRILLANDAKSGWVDLLPFALRDPDLRKLFAGWLRECYSLYLGWFDLEDDRHGPASSDLVQFGAAITALMDGLPLYVGLAVVTVDEAACAAQLVLDSTVQHLLSTPRYSGM